MQIPPGSANASSRAANAVTVDVVAVDDHIAEIDADAESDAFAVGYIGIAVDHRPLHFDRAARRIDNAREFHEHAVAGGLDDAPAVLADLGIDELTAMRLEALECTLLIAAHQPRIPGHIGGKDRRQTACDGLLHRLPTRFTFNQSERPRGAGSWLLAPSYGFEQGEGTAPIRSKLPP